MINFDDVTSDPQAQDQPYRKLIIASSGPGKQINYLI